MDIEAKRKKQRDYMREYSRKRRAIDPGYVSACQTSYRQWKQREYPRYKEACLNMYSNGEATCAWCPQADVDSLCLDHINDDGKQHREFLRGNTKRAVSGVSLYRWCIQNDYPPLFQVLCASCNLKKEVVRRRNKRIAQHGY